MTHSLVSPVTSRRLFCVVGLLLFWLAPGLSDGQSLSRDRQLTSRAAPGLNLPGFQAPCAFPIFDSGTTSAIVDSPYSTAKGDINNDGNLDVVTASFTANTLSVHLGDGFGQF